MPTFSKQLLSGSTNGKGIKVAATAIGSGTTIHTVGSSTTLGDFITLYCMNSDTVSRVLTLGWGGTSSPDDLIVQTIPSKSGLIPVIVRMPLNNSLIVKAACDAANVLIIFGEVSRDA